MQYIKLFLFSILASILFTACGETQSDTSIKKDITIDNTSTNSETTGQNLKKKKAGTSPEVKSTASNKYWPSLKNKLKLSGAQYKKIRSINNKYKKDVAALKNKKSDKEEVNKLRDAVNGEVRNLLGNKKYQQKIAFDKAWKNAQK